jgi:two-component system sensor histidine kinase UhpB
VKKIFIVDYFESTMVLLEQLLYEAGYEVVGKSGSWDKVVGLVSRLMPDLVMMSLNMPEDSRQGIEAARMIREVYDIPTVFLTAYADDNTLEWAKVAKPAAIIVKPFRDDEVRAILHMTFHKLETDKVIIESERFYRILAENYPDSAVFLFDHDLRYMIVGGEALYKMGFSKQDMEGKTLFEVLPAKHTEGLEPLYRSALAGETVQSLRQYKEGYYDVIMKPVYDEDNNIICGMVVSTDITDKKIVEMELMDSREKLRGLSERLQQVREEERNRIAREVHDELGQTLTGLKLDLTSFVRKSGNLTGEQVDQLQEMSAVIDHLVGTVQRITSELRPLVLYDLGLVPAIQGQIENVSSKTGFEYEFIVKREEELEAGLECMEESQLTAVYRIFQEALTNIVRHSSADMVTVSLTINDNLLEIRVADNGVGIKPELIDGSQSMGILGMCERAHFLGGELSLEPVDTGGASVILKVPVKGRGEEDD